MEKFSKLRRYYSEWRDYAMEAAHMRQKCMEYKELRNEQMREQVCKFLSLNSSVSSVFEHTWAV